jgi:uncharacterized protein YndB with AHSA1/START domain
MTAPSGTDTAASHATFSIERTYPAAPARVFHALSDPAAKARWFAGPPGAAIERREMDCRVGGRERLAGSHGDGRRFIFEALYYDVVPDRRLVYAYDMHIDGRHISVSLATVVLTPASGGTKLTITEQDVFLDGYDDAGSRERGTDSLLDKLGAALAVSP